MSLCVTEEKDMTKLADCPHCGSKVKPYGFKNIGNNTVEYYGNCLNVNCEYHGQTLIYEASYVRTIKKYKQISLDSVVSSINRLSKSEKEMLKQIILNE